MPNCNNSPKPQNVLFSTLGIHKKPFGFCGLNTFNFDIPTTFFTIHNSRLNRLITTKF